MNTILTATAAIACPLPQSKLSPLGIYAKSTALVDSKRVFLTENGLKSGEKVDTETGEVVNENITYSHESALFRRFMLQSAARDCLLGVKTNLDKSKRITHCLMTPVSASSDICVVKTTEFQSVHYSGLQTCGSVWDCPCCAHRITEVRKTELNRCVDAWKEQGGRIYMLTLTVPHTASDDLSIIVKKQAKAMSSMTGSKSYRNIKKSIGLVGSVRAWEVTHGSNGWHPHYHIILFCDSSVPYFDTDVLQSYFYKCWSNACRLSGLNPPHMLYGVTVQSGSYAANYVSKGSWSIGHELTKANTKKSRSDKGRNPAQILSDYADKGHLFDKSLYIEYSMSFHGRAQLYWTPGLKALFAIEDLTDDEIAEGLDNDVVQLLRLTLDDWRLVVRHKLRCDVLLLASRDPDSVFRLLSSLRSLS